MKNPGRPGQKLSKREQLACIYALQGDGYKNIARRMAISDSTVGSLLARSYKKLAVSGLTELRNVCGGNRG